VPLRIADRSWLPRFAPRSGFAGCAACRHEGGVGSFARFRKIHPHNDYAHNDALELPDGQVVQVHELAEGQMVRVLQLPVGEAAPSVSKNT
jgi:hypothetical protein